jgi:hypothetical protein
VRDPNAPIAVRVQDIIADLFIENYGLKIQVEELKAELAKRDEPEPGA